MGLIQAFYQTIELWIFVGILGASLFVEEGIKAYSKRKMVDNPTLW